MCNLFPKQAKCLTILLFISVNLVGIIGCQSDPPVPKPRTYPKLIFPERNLTTIDLEYCPFTFQFPSYAQIDQKKTYFGEEPPNPCWFNLHIPSFNADLYLSYHPIKKRKDFDKLIADTYKITNQINRRSDYMDEARIFNKNGAGGMKFEFEGAAASPIHFYLSDTTQHFLKGALYYNSRVQPDSLMPATQFILEDIDVLLGTFSWR